jgi:Mg-chelatase subunit ChlD
MVFRMMLVGIIAFGVFGFLGWIGPAEANNSPKEAAHEEPAHAKEAPSAGKPTHAEKPDGSDKPIHAAKPIHAGKPVHAGKSAGSAKPIHADKSADSKKPAHKEGPPANAPDKPDKADSKKSAEKPAEKLADNPADKPAGIPAESSAGSVGTGNGADIEVVLVMGSSGSMKQTDPLSLRIPAARLFVKLLSPNDQGAVVSFSDKADTLIPLTSASGGENSARLDKALDGLTSTGAHTNLHAALSAALDAFSKDAKSPPPRAVILMSDGRMDTGKPDEDIRLTAAVRGDLYARFNQMGVKLYTIAFTKESDTALLSEMAEKSGGRFFPALLPINFHTVFAGIFESLKTPDMLPLQRDNFTVDDSIREVVIVANKSTPETKISLQDPDGRKLRYEKHPPNIKWSQTHGFDMISLNAPRKGRWNILFSTGKDNKAYVSTDLKLKTDLTEDDLPVNEIATVEAWLEKSEILLDFKSILDQIRFTLEVTSPDGKKSTVELIDTGEEGDRKSGDGIFTGRFTPLVSGAYSVKLAVKGPAFERAKSFSINAGVFKAVLKEESKHEKEPPAEYKEPDDNETPNKDRLHGVKETLLKFAAINLGLVILFLLYRYRGMFRIVVLLARKLSLVVGAGLKRKKGAAPDGEPDE